MIFSLAHILFFFLLLVSCSIFICCRADLADHLVPTFFVLNLNMNLNLFLFPGIFLFVLDGISFALMYLSYSELSIRVSICVILLFFALLFYLIASWSISINFNLCWIADIRYLSHIPWSEARKSRIFTRIFIHFQFDDFSINFGISYYNVYAWVFLCHLTSNRISCSIYETLGYFFQKNLFIIVQQLNLRVSNFWLSH